MKTLLTTWSGWGLWLAPRCWNCRRRRRPDEDAPGRVHTVTVTIEAIEQSTRTMTVKDAKGVYETLQVPAAFTRFSELKVGDKITARYYENVVVRLKKPGEAAVDVDTGAFTRGDGAAGRNARRAANHHRDGDGDGSRRRSPSPSRVRTATCTAGG